MREDDDILQREGSSLTQSDGQGRDIGPDEVRPTSFPPTSGKERDREPALAGDVEEDTSSAVVCHGTLGYGHHMLGRQPSAPAWHLQHEVLDVSTNRPRLNRLPLDVKREEDRLSTFVGWRYQMVVRKEDLARGGFVYTGTADKVRCVFCNTQIHQWEPQDAVEPTHRSFFPACPLVLGHNVGNVPMFGQQGAFQIPHHSASGQSVSGTSGASMPPMTNAVESGPQALNHSSSSSSSSSPRNPRMAVEPERVASFQFWPSQMNQKPEQLALAGLYYTGDGDRVLCFHCDVLLYNWEPRDDPFREHARFSPHCPYLRLVKGSEFIEDVQNPTAGMEGVEDDHDDKGTMDSPAVQALLFEGYSKESIQGALAVLRGKNVEGDQVSAERLMLTLMEMEQPASALASASASQSSTSQHSADFQVLQQENEDLREKQQCKICMERDVTVIFFPCKHLVCCAVCASGVTTCPICRVPIQGREKVFMA